MNIKIGTIIKKLRTEYNLTQDMLATAIGVTPQAISRWEAGGGYPDIELLPALADFFSVSTDVLLGYKLSEREEKIANIKKEMERISEVGTIEERIAFARNALSRYPSDYEIKENLAVCLCFSWFDTKDDSLLTEAENLCNSIIRDCRDEDIRYDSINTLISIYAETKRWDKASETVNLLTPLKYSREIAKSNGIGDGNTELYKQEEIDKLTDCLGTAIYKLVLDNELPNDPSTWDKKIQMQRVAAELYRMIYGDNLMFYHNRLSFIFWVISTYQIAQGKTDDTLDSLETMCFHAVEYDKSYINDHGKHYTSFFTDKLIYPEPSKEFHELKEHSNCYYMLDRLQNERYHAIRQNKRFIEISNRLQEYSK